MIGNRFAIELDLGMFAPIKLLIEGPEVNRKKDGK